MFPIRAENPQFLTPYATWAIVALNLAAWALVQGFGTQPALASSICTLGLLPGELLGHLSAGVGIPISANARCVVADSGIALFAARQRDASLGSLRLPGPNCGYP